MLYVKQKKWQCRLAFLPVGWICVCRSYNIVIEKPVLHFCVSFSLFKERLCLLYCCCIQQTSKSNYSTAAEIESSVFKDHRTWILLSGDFFLMSFLSSQ